MAFNPMDLSGRRVLVTGASSGIGRAVCVCASRLGARVVLTGRDAAALEETRARMADAGAHETVAGDLRDAAFSAALVARARAGGPLDGLVHAAGAGATMPLGVARPALVESALRLHYGAFMDLVREATRPPVPAPGFSVVAVSSVSAAAGWAGGSVYAGAKGALSAAVRALAVEFAPRGWRVNAVSPSAVRTPLFEADARLSGRDEAAVRARQPLGLAEPEQIAGPVCFLLGAAASFVTGVDLPVDGGYLAQ